MATFSCGECSGGVPRGAVFCPRCGSALEWGQELSRGRWFSRLAWVVAILGALAAGIALTRQIRETYEFSWEHARPAVAPAPLRSADAPAVTTQRREPSRADADREQKERLADEARARSLAVNQEETAARAAKAEEAERNKAAAREAYQDCMNKLHTHDVILQDVASVALGARRIEIGTYIVKMKLLQRDLE